MTVNALTEKHSAVLKPYFHVFEKMLAELISNWYRTKNLYDKLDKIQSAINEYMHN